jgi:hypothetical protein
VRSRLYDVWAMGCIVFELVIWLLEGQDGLQRFYHSVSGSTSNAPYFELRSDSLGGKERARLRNAVVRKMAELRASPRCAPGTSLGRLLELVQNRLLVIDLPEKGASREDREPRHLHRRADTFSRNESSPGAESHDLAQFVKLRGPRPSSVHSDVVDTSSEEVPRVQIDDFDAGTGVASRRPASVGEGDGATEPRPEEAKKQIPTRARADELRAELESILNGGEGEEEYWLPSVQSPAMARITDEESGRRLGNALTVSTGSTSFDSGGLNILDSGLTGEHSAFSTATTYVDSSSAAASSPTVLRAQGVGAQFGFPHNKDIKVDSGASSNSPQSKPSATGLLGVPKKQNVSPYCLFRSRCIDKHNHSADFISD